MHDILAVSSNIGQPMSYSIQWYIADYAMLWNSKNPKYFIRTDFFKWTILNIWGFFPTNHHSIINNNTTTIPPKQKHWNHHTTHQTISAGRWVISQNPKTWIWPKFCTILVPPYTQLTLYYFGINHWNSKLPSPQSNTIHITPTMPTCFLS